MQTQRRALILTGSSTSWGFLVIRLTGRSHGDTAPLPTITDRARARSPPFSAPSQRCTVHADIAEALGKELAERIVRGGYPVSRERTPKRKKKRRLYANYIETLVQRDVRDLDHIGSLDALPKLLTLARSQTRGLPKP